MRKFILRGAWLAALFFIPVAAHAQSQVTVSATVKDANNTPCSGGTVNGQLNPVGPNPPTVNGTAISGTAGPAFLDVNGTFSLNVWANSAIQAAGSRWVFTVNCNSGLPPPVGTGGQTTTSGPQNITGNTSLSTVLSANLPLLTNISPGGGGTITGGGASPEIAFWTAATAIGGNVNFIYTPAGGESITAAGAADPALTIIAAGGQTAPMASITNGSTDALQGMITIRGTGLGPDCDGHGLGDKCLLNLSKPADDNSGGTPYMLLMKDEAAPHVTFPSVSWFSASDSGFFVWGAAGDSAAVAAGTDFNMNPETGDILINADFTQGPPQAINSSLFLGHDPVGGGGIGSGALIISPYTGATLTIGQIDTVFGVIGPLESFDGANIEFSTMAGSVTIDDDLIVQYLTVNSGVCTDNTDSLVSCTVPPSVKNQSVTTGSITAASSATVTLTWSAAFADANYIPVCSVTDSTASSLSLSVVHIESFTNAAIVVRIVNNAVATNITGTLNCIAIHN